MTGAHAGDQCLGPIVRRLLRSGECALAVAVYGNEWYGLTESIYALSAFQFATGLFGTAFWRTSVWKLPVISATYPFFRHLSAFVVLPAMWPSMEEFHLGTSLTVHRPSGPRSFVLAQRSLRVWPSSFVANAMRSRSEALRRPEVPEAMCHAGHLTALLSSLGTIPLVAGNFYRVVVAKAAGRDVPEDERGTKVGWQHKRGHAPLEPGLHVPYQMSKCTMRCPFAGAGDRWGLTSLDVVRASPCRGSRLPEPAIGL